MQAESGRLTAEAGASAVSEVVSLTPLDWFLTAFSLLIFFVFVSSLVKWISLLRSGAQLFGERAMVPVRPRPRPFWNPLYFLFFFAVLLVANVQLNHWLAPPQPNREAVVDGVQTETERDADDVVLPAVTPTISVTQLLLSSLSMVAATLATMWLANSFRPPRRQGAGPDEVRPHVGWLPQRGDISLGFTAAWLILPPTMLMMAAVSIMQTYSHPVLDALQPEGGDSSPDFAVFGALFVSTAVITPLVEEFWFRGMLQGGLQRIADAATDTRRWMPAPNDDSVSQRAPPQLAMDDVARGDSNGQSPSNPYSPPQAIQEPTANPLAVAENRNAEISDFATRSDWTPTAVWPIVITSVIFAIMHWGQGLAPIPLFFLSMGLGYLYRQTGSLVPSIIVHFTLNGFTMSATLLELLR